MRRRPSDRPRPRGRGGSTTTDAKVRERADELHKSGMPYQMAMAVAHGRVDLSDALERLAKKERVQRLMERHDLSCALATQIAIGHASLDKVLSRRRLATHREEYRERTCLAPDVRIALALFGGRKVVGTVADVGSFTFHFTPDGEETEEIHKLKAKFAYNPDDWKRVRKVVRADKALKKTASEPAVRPQDRYSCSDKRLFACMDKQRDITVTLLEGEVTRGQVAWFGRYEFALTTKGGAEIVIFRHALRDLSEA
jgi:sRNA-binding regulator protein Hfq